MAGQNFFEGVAGKSGDNVSNQAARSENIKVLFQDYGPTASFKLRNDGLSPEEVGLIEHVMTQRITKNKQTVRWTPASPESLLGVKDGNALKHHRLMTLMLVYPQQAASTVAHSDQAQVASYRMCQFYSQPNSLPDVLVLSMH